MVSSSLKTRTRSLCGVDQALSLRVWAHPPVASVPVTGATASDGADASAGDAGGCGGVGSAATAAEAGDGELGGTSAVDCSKGAVVEFAVVPGNCGGAA